MSDNIIEPGWSTDVGDGLVDGLGETPSTNPAHAPKLRAGAGLAPGTSAAFKQQEDILSSAASSALRHIAQARNEMERGDSRAVEGELNKASVMFEIIAASAPTGGVKDSIGLAKEHLAREDLGQVLSELGAIYRALDDLTAYMSVTDARFHLDKAKAFCTSKNRRMAVTELERTARSLPCIEVDLPLSTTRRLVAQSKAQLSKGNLEAAENALYAAEDNVVFLSVAIHDPLTEAYHALWRAACNWTDGVCETARAEIIRADRYLDYATTDADAATRLIANALSRQLQVLEKQMEGNPEPVARRLEELWKRAKALSERNVEYFAVGWQCHDAAAEFKTDLIEAKRYLSEAEIERFKGTEPGHARRKAEQALCHLNRALERAPKDNAAQILEVRDQVHALARPKSDNSKNFNCKELVSRLGGMIETL